MPPNPVPCACTSDRTTLAHARATAHPLRMHKRPHKPAQGSRFITIQLVGAIEGAQATGIHCQAAGGDGKKLKVGTGAKVKRAHGLCHRVPNNSRIGPRLVAIGAVSEVDLQDHVDPKGCPHQRQTHDHMPKSEGQDQITR